MKGIILAGGSATRLRPITNVTSKQLLPVYDKPMIYYPLETFLRAGITEILIVVSPEFAGDFLRLLGSGRGFGAKLTYEIQDKPEGIAQAFLIGENFIGDDNVALILGDNLFEDDFSSSIQSFQKGGKIFAKEVATPERFGVVAFDDDGRVTSIVEKPSNPASNYAVTGLYIYDNTVIEKAKKLQASPRGELEITDIHNLYLKEGNLSVDLIDGAWFDTGTFESLHDASTFMREKAMLRNPEREALKEKTLRLMNEA